MTLITTLALLSGNAFSAEIPTNKTVLLRGMVTEADGFTHGYTCSGAFIDAEGGILTAAHCADEDAEIEVLTSDGQHYMAEVEKVSDKHDLALIRIDRDQTPFFVLSSSSPVQGEKVYNVGNPLGVTNAYIELMVSKLDGDDIFLNGHVLPGQSGSIVFDKDGKMVGVITRVAIVGFGVTVMGIMESRDAVRFFLKDRLPSTPKKP